MFATHYHELIELEEKLKRVKNYNVDVKEEDGKVIFLRKIVKGGTDESYGIHVAQMAGVPKEVIERSNEILQSLEQESMFAPKRVESELTNKSTAASQLAFSVSAEEHPVLKKLDQIDPDTLTPLDALNELNTLKKLSKKV